MLLAVGADHTTAPLGVRDRLAVGGQALPDALARVRSRVREGFILSTCNRTEIYARVGHSDSGTRLLIELLAEQAGMNADALAPHLVVRAHDEAVRQLFSIAAGVRSMVTGEDQILAQLKGALAAATTAGTLGPVVHRLGTTALAVGKRARSETAIGRHSLSVVSVALQRAAEQLGSLAGKRVVIVGAGHVAELALKHLGGARCTVVNRGAARREALAARYGAHPASWDALADCLAGADLVLSCTGAPGHVIDRALLHAASARRVGAAIVIVDLAVPRDVDPDVRHVPGVALIDVDQLEAVCAANRLLRRSAVVRAESIVAEHVSQYIAWLAARQAAPTIAALVSHASTIRDSEVERTLARMPELGGRERELIRTMAVRIVSSLMHTPVVTLKQHPDAEIMATAVRQLFALEPTAQAVGDAGRDRHVEDIVA